MTVGHQLRLNYFEEIQPYGRDQQENPLRNKYLNRFYAFVLTFLPLHAFAQDGPGTMGTRSSGMMGGMMGFCDGMGIMMIFPILIVILIVVLLILGIMSLFKYMRQG